MLQQKSYILDPIKAAKDGQELDKRFSLTQLSRLHECVVEKAYPFTLTGAFSFEHNKALLDAEIEGVVTLICQRTLEMFDHEIKVTVKLGFVEDDRFFKGFPEAYEAYIYQDQQIDLLEVIEQEIMLNIPMIPKTTLKDCQIDQNASYYGVPETDDSKAEGEKSPFSALKELKFKK